MPTVKTARKAPARTAAHLRFVASDALGTSGVDAELLARLGFEATVGQTVSLVGDGGAADVLVGVGEAAELDENVLRRAAAAGAVAAGRHPTAAVHFDGVIDGRVDAADAVQAVAEGLSLGAYRFDTYKAESPEHLRTVTIVTEGDRRENAALRRADAVASAVCFARDLVNEPGGSLTPTVFADRVAARAAESSVTARVLGPAQIRRQRLGGLLAVNQGSVEEPRLVQLTYTPRSPVGTVALVGKGITFDSGGLSIKPSEAMMTMKCDMAGAAAVAAAVCALDALGVRMKVVAFMPLTDNMTGGSAQRPGDIYTARNGTTVEVLNTDAEGRLVLGEALVLASEAEPDAIIDLATLTGACMVALGDRIAGLLGNDDALVDAVVDAASAAGERVWPLPLAAEYRASLDSPIADVKNIGGGRFGGAITAALFLERFVGEGIPWAHLDIAGPAFADSAASDDALVPRGATGFGVRTLLRLLEAMGAGSGAQSPQR